MDASIIASLGSSLASASTIAKALMGMKIDQEVISKVSALQAEIMSAQSAALSSLADRVQLMDKVQQLEGELKAISAWSEQAQRYKLTSFPTGAQVYVLRDEQIGDESLHRICPACFQKSKKSILQTTKSVRGGEVVAC